MVSRVIHGKVQEVTPVQFGLYEEKLQLLHAEGARASLPLPVETLFGWFQFEIECQAKGR